VSIIIKKTRDERDLLEAWHDYLQIEIETAPWKPLRRRFLNVALADGACCARLCVSALAKASVRRASSTLALACMAANRRGH